MTIPEPLGKKSRPTIDSKTELLPEDYAPTTTSYGSSIEFGVLIMLNAFCNFIIKGTKDSIPSTVYDVNFSIKINVVKKPSTQ